QIRRLVFAGNGPAAQRSDTDAGKQSSAVVCRRRLKALGTARNGSAYLRRLSFRNAENKPGAVFGATVLGCRIASQLLHRTLPLLSENVTPSFLARTVRLNDLYLALAQTCRAADAPFVWIPANATELPWQQLNHRMGRIEARR